MIVYFHRNPVTYEIFYVGIASQKGRAQRPYKKDNRNKYWHHTVNKYGNPIVQIVHTGLTKDDACKWEIFYISLLGKKINGGQLVNIADGGATNAGYTHTQKQRDASRERAIKNGIAHLLTKEARMKAALTIKNRPKGIFVGERNSNYGNKWTAEMKQRASDRKKGKKFSDQVKAVKSFKNRIV